MRITVNTYEQNSFADNRTCNNGGGYHQPLILIDGDDWKAVIDDKCCGDFGSEVSIDIEKDGVIYSCYYGSRVDHEWSNIEYDSCKDILEIFSRHLGYHPPVKGNWNWGDESRSGRIDFDTEVNDRHLDEESYDGKWIIDTDQEGEYNNPYFPWTCDDGNDEYYDYYDAEEE